MKEIELKNGKRVEILAIVLFASVALAATLLLLPPVQNIAIAFGEKLLGRELRDYEKWYRIITIYGFFILASECIGVFFYWDINWHYGKIVRKIKRHGYLEYVVIILAAFVFTLTQCRSTVFGTGNAGTDSSVFKYTAFAMSKGLLPYRDAFDHKGVLVYLINLLGLKINFFHGEWFFELASICVTFYFMYKTARIVSDKLISVISVFISTSSLFIFLEGGNFTEEYAMPFIAVSLFIFCDYFINGKINKFRLLSCGFSFGAVCMLRVNMTGVWIVFCIAVLVKCIDKKKFSDIWSFLLWFMLGFFLLILPICIWLLANGVFKDFIDSYIIFNLKYSARGASFYMRISSLKSFLKVKIIYISIMILIFNIFQKTKQNFSILYLLSFLCCFLMMVISGRSYYHYAMILVPMFVFPIAMFMDSCVQVFIFSKQLRIFFVIVFLIFLSAESFGWYRAFTNAFSLPFQKSNLSQPLSTVCDLILKSTSETDTISVYGNKSAFYIYSKRLSASKYSYQFPIGQVDTKIMDEYFSDLEKSLPKILVIQGGRFDERIESFLDNHNYKKIFSEELHNENKTTPTEAWIR